MKKLFILSLVVLLVACANEPEKPEYTVLDVNLKNSVAETALVRGHGFEKEIAIPVGSVFTDTLNIPKDGYYDIMINRERATLYLEKGKSLGINLDAMQFDETLAFTGDLAAENNYLAAKYLYDEENSDFQDFYTSSETDFITKVNTLNDGLKKLLVDANIQNEAFVEREKKEQLYNHTTNVEMYHDYHKYLTKNPEFQVSENYYDMLGNIDYTDTTEFRNSRAYERMVDGHFNRISGIGANEPGYNATLAYLTVVDENLPDGYAKEQLMTNYLRFGLKADESLDEVYQIYKTSNPSAENLDAITARYKMLSTLTKGKPSPEFDYENFKGGKTALEDLRGKYVYIDVWATWCGPCIREIPSLKAVEKDYKNKNIEFVSISIDVERDYEKWKKMIPEKELGGIQLLADNDWKSDFVKDYGINGIPRFILIDPEGNIVSSDAPRPSDPKLRTMLNELI